MERRHAQPENARQGQGVLGAEVFLTVETVKELEMDLTIGQQYRKSDFGISGIVNMWSEITVCGELYTFFAMDSKYTNICEEDGFVYEGRGKYALIPQGAQTDLHRHVFVRKKTGEAYTYLGKGQYERRYNEKCNKIFWQ
jgi:hypothetical protein